MSPPKPSITEITLNAISNNALMIALFNHFNGGSLYFQPVLDGSLNPIENGLTSGEDSFLIEPVDSDESWQVNFRRTPNDRGLVMLDPGNGITDSGTVSTLPIGATSQASSEVDYPWYMTWALSSAKILVLEWYNSFMVLIPDNGTASLSYSCHVGRVHSPFNSNNALDGLDGLGILCGKPRLIEASLASAWASAVTTTQQIRIGPTTWVDTVTAWRSTSGYDAFVGARPDGVIIRYQGRPIGVLNYALNFTGSEEISFTLLYDGSDVAQYLYFFSQSGTTTQVLPWVDGKTVTPYVDPPLPEYEFYSDLPATGSEGDLAKLTDPSSAGVYMYSSSIGGDSFGMWVPEWAGLRIDDYVRDASSNPCKLSTVAGIGTDTKAILTSRGWTANETSPATVSDVSGTIELNTSTGGQEPALEFTPAADLSAGTYFVVMEGNAITRNAISNHLGAAFSIADGGEDTYVSLTHSAVLNQVSWVQTVSLDAGSGYLSQSAFDRLFAIFNVGTTVGAELYACWEAGTGWPATEVVATADRSDFTQTPTSRLIKVMAETDSGNKWQVREFHVIALTS